MGDATQPEKKLQVAIIGAGIVGLILAQGLKKNGISLRIFEREESPTHHRSREWGMSLHWSLSMLETVLPKDLFDRIQQDASVNPNCEVQAEGNYLPIFNGETGEHIKNVPWGKVIRVSRRKMRALCAEGVEIEYNKQFRALRVDVETGRPKVLFLDGSSVTADLVVGADGANSEVRQSVFVGGEGQAHQIPYGGINTHVCYKDAALARKVYDTTGPSQSSIIVHPKGYWLWFSIQDASSPDPAEWLFQLQWTWKLPSPLESRELSILQAEAEKEFAEPFKTFWTRIPSSTPSPLPPTRMAIWPPLPIPDDVFRGHVALVGDAAHPMSFHRGQGLNHGVADVAKLVSVLVERGALDEYETEMIKRAGEEVALSKRNTEMLHDWERVKESPFMKGGGTAEQR